MRAHPGRHSERAVGLVAAGLLEAPDGFGVDRLQAVDQGSVLNDDIAELLGGLVRDPVGHVLYRRSGPRNRGLAAPADAQTIVTHDFDSCLSKLSTICKFGASSSGSELVDVHRWFDLRNLWRQPFPKPGAEPIQAPSQLVAIVLDRVFDHEVGQPLPGESFE